jgi:hypothetical protein
VCHDAGGQEGVTATTTDTDDVNYDPHDGATSANPYPAFRRERLTGTETRLTG